MILQDIDLIPMTEQTITDKNTLRDEMDRILEQGYAVSRGEWIIDASGVAAPIFNQGGQITAAITISGPQQRFTEEKISEIAKLLVKEAEYISLEMGYYPR